MPDRGDTFPNDYELISRVEQLVYNMRLAALRGEVTDLHLQDNRPVVVIRMLYLALVFICAVAEKKKMTHGDMRNLFAEMRIAQRRGTL